MYVHSLLNLLVADTSSRLFSENSETRQMQPTKTTATDMPALPLISNLTSDQKRRFLPRASPSSAVKPGSCPLSYSRGGGLSNDVGRQPLPRRQAHLQQATAQLTPRPAIRRLARAPPHQVRATRGHLCLRTCPRRLRRSIRPLWSISPCSHRRHPLPSLIRLSSSR